MITIKRTPRTISLTFRTKKNRFNKKMWSVRKGSIVKMVKTARVSTLQKVQKLLEAEDNA